MKSLNRKDIKTGTILEALEREFQMSQHFKPNHPVNFLEFTLEDLGLPSAQQLLEATLEIERRNGIRGFYGKGQESETYKGFSICYNPEVGVDPFATLGDKRLQQTFSRVDGQSFEELRNTYHDSYGFTAVHPVVQELYGPLLDRFRLCPTRSRTSYIVPANDKIYGDSTWHRDEFVFQNMRMNIPLQTEEAYVLEIKGEDEYGNSLNMVKHLEVGKAYVWNTRIPHRVFANKPVTSSLPRIHIVLGFIPWFNVNNDTGEFTPNEFFGEHPFDLWLSRRALK